MKFHSFRRIYSGDYHDIGFQRGTEDAREGKPRSHFGLLTDLSPFNYLWRYEDSVKSDTEGYEKGYDAELLAQTLSHTTFQQSTTQGITMSNLKNYDEAISALQETKTTLRQNISDLGYYLRQYDNKVASMVGEGFLTDYANQLNSEKGLRVRIDGLKTILEQVITQLDKVSREVTELKHNAQQSNY